jgi:hypothetical protein
MKKRLFGLAIAGAALSKTANAATIIMGDPALQNLVPQNKFSALDQMIADRAAIGKHPMLGDQAPDSPWSVDPVKSPNGDVSCIAAVPMNFIDAEVTDQNGNLLTSEQKDGLSYNTPFMKVVESGSTFDAYGSVGFPTAPGETNITADGSSLPIRPLTDDAAEILNAVAITEAQNGITVTATSDRTDWHTVPYKVDAPFPLETFAECNNKAAAGEFDAAFAAIHPNTIMIVDLPEDAAAQASLKESFTEGGLCTKGFKPEEYGTIEYSATWLPATIAGITRDENGDFSGLAVGDLFRATENTASKSISLSGSPFDGPETSGCAGQGPSICIEATESNGKLTISFCEGALSSFVPSDKPDVPVAKIADSIFPITPIFIPGTVIKTPHGGGDDIPWNPIDPDHPVCVVDCGGTPPDVTPPPAVPLPDSILLMGTVVAAFAAAAIMRKRGIATALETKVAPEPSL